MSNSVVHSNRDKSAFGEESKSHVLLKANSKTSSSTGNSEKPPSKIPVYSLNKRQGSVDFLKQNDICHLQTKHSLSTHQLSDLPESIKLMHMVHCYSNHPQKTNLPRSQTHNFDIMPNSSHQSTSAGSPGTFTPKDRKLSNASSAKSSNSNKRKPMANRKGGIINGKMKQNSYDEYLPLCEMQKGLEKGDIVEGILRINPKNYNDAYISAPEKGLDIFIGGLYNRNRALNGDVVAVKLNNLNDWTISASSINSNWLEWKNNFEQYICDDAEKSCLPISHDLLKSKLSNQDIMKLEIGFKASKSDDIKDILKSEFPNVPFSIYTKAISELEKLPNSEKFLQKSGKVVHVIEQNHTRTAGGIIQLEKAKTTPNSNVKFIPNDCRVPHVIIPFNSLPSAFAHNYELMKDNLFLVNITDWPANSLFPRGQILESLGKCGDLDAETEILLKGYDIDTSEFPEEALAEYDLFSDDRWTIPNKEYEYRRDFRKHCVFTIDPQSARDLDDAISLVKLPGNRMEIGVHIADVSYFIREKTLLNGIARKRATSVYLPNKVIPMLPHLFCQHLCSLNAGEDKLTFSVVFTMDDEGKVFDKWIGRTVINSCAKLSYENAQRMIEATADQVFEEDEFPHIFNGYSLLYISEKVKALNRIAQCIRKCRFSQGSLRLDKNKIGFLLNEDGLPVGFSKYELKDSNRMIEELMLLANRAVAERIFDCFSAEGRAFLRGHPSPNLFNMNEFQTFLKQTNIEFDMTNSQSIYNSLQRLQEQNPLHFRLCTMNLIKSMKLATYMCVSSTHSPQAYHHYALNFSKYTHFTSPIRRYADVIVHRLLAGSLGYDSVCNDNLAMLEDVAKNCNTRKYNAYIISEKSNEVYLKTFISSIGSMITKAAVCNVYDHSFDVLLLQFDIICRVYLNQLPLVSFDFHKENGLPQLKLKWLPFLDNESGEPKSSEQIISYFLELEVKVVIDSKFHFVLLIANPNGEYIQVPSSQQQKQKAMNSDADESSKAHCQEMEADKH